MGTDRFRGNFSTRNRSAGSVLRACNIALFCIGLASVACTGPGVGTRSGEAFSDCVKAYRPATVDPMPSGGLASGFAQGATYAAPCESLSRGGPMEWAVLVVASDDVTIRAYFIGGRVEDRCGLLRSVSIAEDSTDVVVELEAGGDPSAVGTACSAVGQNYVTEVSLSKPLGTRKLSGTNNQGVIEHL